MYIIESFMYIHIIIDLFSTQKKMQLFRGYNRQHHITNVTWHTAPKNHYHLNCFPPSFWCKSMGNWRQKRPERPNFLPSGMTFVALSLVVAEDSEDWKSLSPLSPSWGDIIRNLADMKPLKSSRIDWKKGMEIYPGLSCWNRCFGNRDFLWWKNVEKRMPRMADRMFCSEIPWKKILPSFRIPTQLEKIRKAFMKITKWNRSLFRWWCPSSSQRSHFQTIPAPHLTKTPENLKHDPCKGGNFFLLLKPKKKPTCSPQSTLSIHPLPLLPGKKTPWGPKGNSGSSAWKWRHLEIRYDPGFATDMATGWMEIFWTNSKKKQLTNWSFLYKKQSNPSH